MPGQTLSGLFLIAAVPVLDSLLYWIENGIVGFFNVLKIAWARTSVSSESRFTVNGRPAGRVSKVYMIPFFVSHTECSGSCKGSS